MFGGHFLKVSPARIVDFSGALPPQRNARKGNCLSAVSAEFEESAERSAANFAFAA
jgi:hypothetical protein